MLRKASIGAHGVLHHVIIKQIERGKIFYDDSNLDNFLNWPDIFLTDAKTTCFKRTLIPNHLHLLLGAGLDNDTK